MTKQSSGSWDDEIKDAVTVLGQKLPAFSNHLPPTEFGQVQIAFNEVVRQVNQCGRHMDTFSSTSSQMFDLAHQMAVMTMGESTGFDQSSPSQGSIGDFLIGNEQSTTDEPVNDGTEGDGVVGGDMTDDGANEMQATTVGQGGVGGGTAVDVVGGTVAAASNGMPVLAPHVTPLLTPNDVSILATIGMPVLTSEVLDPYGFLSTLQPSVVNDHNAVAVAYQHPPTVPNQPRVEYSKIAYQDPSVYNHQHQQQRDQHYWRTGSIDEQPGTSGSIGEQPGTSYIHQQQQPQSSITKVRATTADGDEFQHQQPGTVPSPQTAVASAMTQTAAAAKAEATVAEVAARTAMIPATSSTSVKGGVRRSSMKKTTKRKKEDDDDVFDKIAALLQEAKKSRGRLAD